MTNVDACETEKEAAVLMNATAVQHQVKVLEKQRNQILEEANHGNRDEIVRFRQEYDDRNRKNSVFHLSKAEEQQRKSTEQLATIRSDSKERQSHTELQNERRVALLKDKNGAEFRQREDFFKAAIAEARIGFEEQLQGMRTKHHQEKQAMIGQFREYMKRSEKGHDETFYRKVNEYEKQIQDLNDKYIKDFRLQNKRHQALLKQEQRESETEKESLRVGYQGVVEQIKESSRAEIEKLKERHQQEMQRLAVVTKKS